MPDFLLWQEDVGGLRPAELGEFLRSGGNFIEAEEVATIKAASNTENSVKPERKRGRGIGKSQKLERAEASIYFEVESRIQTSGKPESKQGLVGYKWEDNITWKCFIVFNIILEISGISLYGEPLTFQVQDEADSRNL